MRNLNRYFFHPDGMRLDLSQKGAKVRGVWVKFDDVVAQNSTTNNKVKAEIAALESELRMVGCASVEDTELLCSIREKMRQLFFCLGNGV